MSKTVLITGASRGIGRSIALKFAQNNYYVFINASKSQHELLTLQDEIIAMGTQCHPLLYDVSDYTAVKNMCEEILLITPKIDIIINNAGIAYYNLLTETPSDIWQQLINTNLTSIYNICHCLIPNMIQHQSGVIINISSIWGIDGASCEVAYSATKGGVNAFTKALAKELGPSHIRVNAIACGAINTTMNSSFTHEEKALFEDQVALGRFGLPEEVASLAYYLASDQASYMTGEIIRLDGGM